MFLAVDLSVLASLNYLFYIVIAFAVLAGFLRGFKKTIFTLIMMVLFYVIFFVTLNQAVEFLYTFEMPWLAGPLSSVDPALSNFTTFEGSLDTFIQMGLDGTINLSGSSAEVTALFEGIMKFALKLVWTIAYFTVILLVYKIICWIIGAIFLKTQKGASKNRGLGAIIGIANGILAVFLLLVMMGGLFSVVESTVTLLPDGAEELNYFVEPNQTPFDGTVPLTPRPLAETDMAEIKEQLEGVVEAYHTNIFVTIADKITTTSSLNETIEVPLNIDLFDRILSFEYDEASIGLRYELQVFSAAASVFLQSDFYESNDITDITGDEIRDAFSHLSQSILITSLIPVAIEVGADMNDIDLGIDKDTLYGINYETELTELGSIAGALFDILNGAGFIGGEGSVDQITIDGPTVIGIFEDMSESQTIVLLLENLLLPMVEEQTGDFAAILEIPDDFDTEAELLALGDIFAEIVELDDVSFENLASGDMNVLLDAVSQMNLDVLLDSQLLTEALINILSGEAGIEGLDIIEVPTGIQWKDQGDQDGELRKILGSLSVLFEIADGVDFETLDINTLLDLTDTQIDTFFDSYVIRATVSDIISSTDLGDIPLVFPDAIYDTQDYFTKAELTNMVKAVKMMFDTTSSEFDIMKALNLTPTEMDTLLASEIIYATIGKEIIDLGTSALTIPLSTQTDILVDGVNQTVITRLEIKNILSALAVLELTSLDSVSFDANILSTLENTAGDDLDDTKLSTLLGSNIVHATVSDMILDLDVSAGGVLVVPDTDELGNPIKTAVPADGLTLVETTEIINVLKALYAIDITNFSTINLEDTSLILDHIDVLITSGIIHATVSDFLLDLDTVLTIPEENSLGEDILITQGTTTFIESDEISALFEAFDLLGFNNPNTFTTGFSFSVFTDPANHDTLLNSGIVHATISDQMFTLAAGTFIIPDFQEDGLTEVRVETGSLGNETEFIEINELKELFSAIDAMDITDFTDLNTGVSGDMILDISSYVDTSSIIQATISDIILTAAQGATNPLVIPDEDQSSQALKIDDTSGVTYIWSTELARFVDAVNTLGLGDFSTFSFNPTDIFAVSDKPAFFSSNIMQATASKYIIDVSSGDQFTAAGTTGLLIPTTVKQAIEVETVASEQITVTELIHIFDVLDFLNMNDFSAASSVDTSVISGKTRDEIHDDILISESFYVTIDNMINANASVSSNIPTIAKTTAHTITMTTKDEISDLIVSINIISGGSGDDFTNITLTPASVTGLGQEDRDDAIISLTIRHYLTPTLKLLPGSPTAPTDFEPTSGGDTQETYILSVAKSILDTNYPTV